MQEAVRLLLSSVVIVTCVAEYSGSLRLVNVVFRHGQRTPADTYPNDPYVLHDFQPYGWGQLTNKGKLEQHLLGDFLRVRYGDFLDDSGRGDTAVRIQSTDSDRTIMSAQLVSAGLLPPKGTQQWRPELQWQPVPIHSQPLQEDSMLLVRIPCGRYYEVRDSVKNMEPVKNYLSSLTDLFKSLSKHSGMDINDPDDVQSLYSTMLAEVQFNLSLPEWTRDYFPEKMATVTAYSFTLNAYNDELKKLKGGPLLKRILENMKEKVKDPTNKLKMFLYAGHDSTVANLMMALRVWEEQIPVYNIMAVIELHEVDNIYGVKVFLKNSTEQEPYLLRIPSCEYFCPLEKVEQISKNVLPLDLEKECMSHNPEYKPPTISGP